MLRGHADTAIHHFVEAERLDPKASAAIEGHAIALAGCDRFLEAVDRMNDAIRMDHPLGISFIHYDDRLQRKITKLGRWKACMGDLDGAVEAAQMAFEHNGSTIWGYSDLLISLAELGRQEQVLNILKDLDSHTNLEKRSLLVEPNQEKRSLLVELIRIGSDTLFKQIGLISRKAGGPTFIINALKAALDFVDHESPFNLDLNMRVAQFHCEYLDDWQLGTAILEEANDIIEAHTADLLTEPMDFLFSPWKTCGDRFQTTLGGIYFNVAMERRDEGKDSSHAVSRLKALAEVDRARQGLWGFSLPQNGLQQLWGRWLRFFEKTEVAEWKKWFTHSIIDDLEHFRPNKWRGEHQLLRLARLLLIAGEVMDAGALYAGAVARFEAKLSRQKARRVEEADAWRFQGQQDERNKGIKISNLTDQSTHGMETSTRLSIQPLDSVIPPPLPFACAPDGITNAWIEIRASSSSPGSCLVCEKSANADTDDIEL